MSGFDMMLGLQMFLPSGLEIEGGLARRRNLTQQRLLYEHTHQSSITTAISQLSSIMFRRKMFLYRRLTMIRARALRKMALEHFTLRARQMRLFVLLQLTGGVERLGALQIRTRTLVGTRGT
jgi:hypothetical protein